MKKAEIIKNGNLNITNVKLNDKEKNELAEKINGKLGNVVESTDKLIESLRAQKPDYDKYYSDIEDAIIRWNIDGTKTAGALTRKIIRILKKKK